MQQAEVYHIYHLGEQRGPYSIRQVNHLYRCGYVSDDAMYWREGMEQWQPISEIVEVRIQRHKLRKWGLTAAIAGFAALLVFLFGPVTVEAWRELTSGDFTRESAWWRARGIMRENHPEGRRLVFLPYSTSEVRLVGNDAAEVTLGWEKLGSSAGPARRTVSLHYDAERRAWELRGGGESQESQEPEEPEPASGKEPSVIATVPGFTSSAKNSPAPAIQ